MSALGPSFLFLLGQVPHAESPPRKIVSLPIKRGRTWMIYLLLARARHKHGILGRMAPRRPHTAMTISRSASSQYTGLVSSRAKDRYDGAHTHRLCLGVMKCTNRHCEIITRPQTKNAGRRAQLEAGCSCGSALRHYTCGVQIKDWVCRDGAHFQHSGYHHHEKVPVRHLTLRERVQFETVVNEHPRMGPAQLLAGRPAVDGPGPSVADISTVLLNPHRIQCERRKILNPENKIRDWRFLPKLERFKEKHPDWMLAKLLVSFPGDHPVVRSYNAFFRDRPEDHRDTHIEHWLPEGLHQPERELTALMERPLQRLQDFRLVSVPGPERRYRVIGVGRAMLQLLALQHELGEPLDLNGDTFDDLVEGDIKATQMESHEATRAMFLATKPKLFSHKRFWDLDTFHASLLQFSDTHAIFDPMFRPPTFNRFGIREIKRPAIAIEMAPSDKEKSRGNIRRRSNNDEELAEDIPPAKRQATPRRLRPRGNDSRTEKVALAPPVGKVVASGRGWYTIDLDDG
ncbi:hypothetical protein B0H13DRAFT_1918505 [Mycena leptocephala]|nr:hypothetical protein B0H13DRAFT_1918505 [Mycena leptocephala]